MSLVYAIADPHSDDDRRFAAAGAGSSSGHTRNSRSRRPAIVSGEALGNVVEMRGR